MGTEDFEYVKILIEKGKFIYIVTDENFITETVNPYFTELTGYLPEEIVGKRSTEVLDPPDIRKRVESVLRELESRGKFKINENPIVTKSGEFKHILWYNVWDEKNRKHISIGIDITNLRETERVLRERNEYIFRLTREVKAYIRRTLVTEDGKEKTVYYTDSIENVSGYPSEYFLNKEFIPSEEAFLRRIIHPQDLPLFEKNTKEVLMKGKTLTQELRIVKKNGEIAWVYEYLTPVIEDGKVKELLGVGIDITRDKKREIELEEKNRELEFLLDTVNAYIFRVTLLPDGTSKVLFYSEGIKNVTGYTREEFFSGKISWEDIVYPPDREVHRREVEKKALKGIPGFVEYRIRKKDGTLIWVMDSIKPTVKEDGSVEVVGVCIDIDDRKKMEKESKALERLQVMGFISSNIAHIFNNILTGLVGYLSIIKLKFPSPSIEYETLMRIEKGMEKMVEINNRLLGYARLGKHREERLNVNLIIKDIIARFKQTAEVEGIDISVEFHPSPCEIKGDENQIRMIFKIIIEGLLEKLESGDSIGINTDVIELGEKDRIGKPYIVPGKYVKITVEDSGTSFTEEEIGKIFEPTVSPDIILSGKGLDFAAVYGVVKSHKGFVWVEAKKEKGNILTIYLPCIE